MFGRRFGAGIAAVAAGLAIGGGAIFYHGVSSGGGGGGGGDCPIYGAGSTGGGSCGTAPACSTTISSGLVSAVTAASAGAVVCLNSGTYGAADFETISKASKVTIRPAASATVTVGPIDVNNSNNLDFSGLGGSMTFTFFESLGGGNTNLTIDNVVMKANTGGVIFADNVHSGNIVFNHDNFDNLPNALSDGRFEVCANGSCPTQTSGTDLRLTIEDSSFSGQASTGCSDGVQDTGTNYGVSILNNNFTGFTEAGPPDGACGGLHTDTIQMQDGDNWKINGNWFHDNGTGTGGISAFAGLDGPLDVENNVFASCGYAHPGSFYGVVNLTFAHNTVVCADTLFTSYSPLPVTSGTSTNNVWAQNGDQSNDTPAGSSVVESWNICDTTAGGCAGSHDISSATVTFAGGTTPSSYAGYALAASSQGYNAGSDGKSMGITP